MPPLPHAMCTCADFYATQALDPHCGACANTVADAAAAANGQPRYSPAALFTRLTAACLGNDPGKIQISHRISTHPITVVGDPQPWDGRHFGLVGDLTHDQHQVAKHTADSMQLAPAGMHVLEDAAMLAVIAATPDGLHPAVNDQTPDAVEVRTRMATSVPFNYVNLLLNASLTPKEAFVAVHGMATARNQVDELRPLLDFLKVTATAAAQDPDASAVMQEWPNPPQPPNDALIHFFEQKVNRDLPSRASLAGPTLPQFQPVITAVDNLTAEQRQQRLDAVAHQQASERGKTPQQFFGEHGVIKLMRLCQVHQEDQLPPLWAQLAAAAKTSRITAVQNVVNEQCQAQRVYIDVPVTVNMVTKLVNLTLAGHDRDEISQGINPFLFGLTTPQQAVQIADRISLHQQIHGGAGAPSIADTVHLEAPDDTKVATSMQATQHSLDGLRATLSAMLGAHHPILVCLGDLRQSLDICANELNAQLLDHPTLPADIQRCVQVELLHWFRQQERIHQQVPFTVHPIGYEAAKGAMFWCCDLPCTVRPASHRPANTNTPAPAPASAPAAQSRETPGANTLQRNPEYDARFDEIRARPNVRSRDVKLRCNENNIALPLDAQGRVRCLPHHIEGQCNTNCGSSHDHRTGHTEEEQNTLYEWAAEHWTTEQVVGNGSSSGTVNLVPIPPPPPQAVQFGQQQRRPTLRGQAIAASVETDKLGKSITRDAKILRQHGLSHLLRQCRGRGDLGPMRRIQNHPARRILRHHQHHGVPITVADAPWSSEELDASVDRGPHKSACECVEFLREDMSDCVDKGFWVVVPYEEVRQLPGLRISPIGVVPQHSQRPRPIVDYTHFGTNDATQPDAPVEATQFGRALDRLLHRILLADPAKGRVYLMKIDMSDGFHRLSLAPHQAQALAVSFPSLPGEPPLVAVPASPPMGWKNSPPSFCVVTETGADLSNQLLLQNHQAPPHRLEHAANGRCALLRPTPLPNPALAVPAPTAVDPHLQHHRRRRLRYVDIYVDDCMGAAQGSRRSRLNVHRTIMMALDDVFRPLDDTDAVHRKEPISIKKLRKGDARWSTQKEVLGWLVDAKAMTLRLTDRRLNRLVTTIHKDCPHTRTCSAVSDHHHLLGELRSPSIAIPGARGLFSHLQDLLRHTTPDARVHLGPAFHSIMDDFRDLHACVEQRPVRIQELVPLDPSVHGCHDAAGHGAGGVILPTAASAPRATKLKFSPHGRRRIQTNPGPVVWRVPFPNQVTQDLATCENPHGPITNTDLELVGSIVHTCAASECFDLRERTNLQRTDGLGTLFWQRKGSSTASKLRAEFHHCQACHQRFHRHVTIHDFLQGTLNTATDDASRLQSLTNTEFLHHFNAHCPQTKPWRLWTPPRKLISFVTSVLHREPLPSQLPLHEPPPPMPIGTSGPISATHWPSIHSLSSRRPHLIPPSLPPPMSSRSPRPTWQSRPCTHR